MRRFKIGLLQPTVRHDYRWKIYFTIFICGLSTGVYCLLFIHSQEIRFSYSSEVSCTKRITLFPDLYRQNSSNHLNVELTSRISIAGYNIFSRDVCVSPRNELPTNSERVAVSLLGTPFYSENFRITMPDAPVVRGLSDTTIPSSRPLAISLSSPDVHNVYTIRNGSDIAGCTAVVDRSSIVCDVPALKLTQGKRYTLTVDRGYKDSPSYEALTQTVQTLTATTITSGSIEQDQVIYDKLKSFTFQADKGLRQAKMVIRGDGREYPVNVRVENNSLTGELDDDLARGEKYVLSITDVESVDGSSLLQPYEVNFSVSEGPKVTSVSIGSSGVSPNARIVISLDQEISLQQDIDKYVRVSGAAATLERTSRSVIINLNAGRCAPFSITVAKGLLSRYDIPSQSDWTRSARTSCYTTSVYGRSLQNRALVTYQFGSSGAATMYVGAIHGNEPSSKGLMESWISYLDTHPDLYRNRKIVIIPNINPDGIVAGTRTNSRGVNLNRNFPTDGWEKDIDDTDGYHKGGGGVSPLSEPEASALARFTTNLRPRLLLSFHAVGSLVTGDPGGYSAGYAAKYASMVGYRNATGQSGAFDYSITGAYEDWTYVKQGIPSMVIELGSYGYYDFPHHQAALRAMLE